MSLAIGSEMGNRVRRPNINDKAYQPWKLFEVDITPNALLSIITTIQRASLLLPVAESVGQLKWLYLESTSRRLIDLEAFDEASRGPIGSLNLLWRTRGRALLAGLGALLAVLALATEPFTQQALTYLVKLDLVTNETATIGRTSKLVCLV
ncbi:hypothetical protein AC578_3785 [Pseudocercospora eumusae]|uniref:Uncharacterized protein n=1 Tax=Pseudocercospora eumusae TaxID=321146 RepID=A0A139HAI4_9PEZI|nr:hypothetical protein AC578_3785 [Pseudocercospora eumusae]